jgi:DNA-binding response OmpR family regulator
MNGVEPRGNQKAFAFHIIMVTGNLTDDIRDECIKLGATDYLRKPIQMSELKA